MKVYLLKDVQGVGLAGEVVKVKEGYADNFLLPRKAAVKITKKNESFYESRAKVVDNRKEVISTQTSMLAEKIKDLSLTLKRKMHDDGKLYASVNPAEIVELLATAGVSVSKSQIKLDKAIKEKGSFGVTIKLTSKLQSILQLKVIPEHSKA
ncbi:50S ribosomal protein L9 [Candidatus Babeliales bacterium]|nr:50S ribosomal protein L9 [Candidatus Babeliales bacterium]